MKRSRSVSVHNESPSSQPKKVARHNTVTPHSTNVTCLIRQCRTHLPPRVRAHRLAFRMGQHAVAARDSQLSIRERTFVSKVTALTTRQRKLPCDNLNKIFACCWINHRQVLTGSKCGQLRLFDMNTMKQMPIPIPPLETDGRAVREGGIHGLALNPSRTRLASAGTNSSCDVGIFQSPSLSMTHSLRGHDGWVFGVDWVSDDIVVSASRDRRVSVWKLPPHSSEGVPAGRIYPKRSIVTSPTVSTVLEGRARDVKFHRLEDKIATLSLHGDVRFWDLTPDAQLKATTSYVLEHKEEAVTIATDPEEPLLAVGSLRAITFFDPRCKGPESTFHIATPTTDTLDGIRSLSFQCNGRYLTCGGGGGRVAFVDMRKRSFLNFAGDTPAAPPSEFERGIPASPEEGRAGENAPVSIDVQANRLLSVTGPCAVYAHAWDPSETKLVIAGGPLQVGWNGAFARLWG